MTAFLPLIMWQIWVESILLLSNSQFSTKKPNEEFWAEKTPGPFTTSGLAGALDLLK